MRPLRTAWLALDPSELSVWAEAFRARGFVLVDEGACPPPAVVLRREGDRIAIASAPCEWGVVLSGWIAPSDAAVIAGLIARASDIGDRFRELDASGSTTFLAHLLAHDARAAIQTMLLAAATLVEQSPPETRGLAQEIVTGCMRLAGMLGRLCTRPHDGREPTAIDVNDVVRGLLPMLRALDGGQARMATRLESSLPLVRVDLADLERTLSNLVANARDASRDGARIVVATRAVSVDPATPADPQTWVVIAVEDCGAGMDDATRARAFEPFFTTKPSGEGGGLGLSSVRDATERAGGHVRIESAPGAGTRVELWLPAVMSDDRRRS